MSDTPLRPRSITEIVDTAFTLYRRHVSQFVMVAAIAYAPYLLFIVVRGRQFFDVADLVAPCVPTGLGSGRIGNFINGELPGRLADPSLPWGMVYPNAGPAPRHPSSLYQFLLEGVVLFVVLWLYARKPRGLGQVSGAFLIGYGVVRFTSEFFREPDDFLGLLSLGLSMGQWLCVPMIGVGIAIWLWGRDRQPR